MFFEKTKPFLFRIGILYQYRIWITGKNTCNTWYNCTDVYLLFVEPSNLILIIYGTYNMVYVTYNMYLKFKF